MRIQNCMKKIFEKRAITWLFLCVFTLSFTQSKANAISSNAVTGNWSSIASWSGGIVPTKNDTVTIISGSTITVDIDTSKCYKLKINSGGILNLSTHILCQPNYILVHREWPLYNLFRRNFKFKYRNNLFNW